MDGQHWQGHMGEHSSCFSVFSSRSTAPVMLALVIWSTCCDVPISEASPHGAKAMANRSRINMEEVIFIVESESQCYGILLSPTTKAFKQKCAGFYLIINGTRKPPVQRMLTILIIVSYHYNHLKISVLQLNSLYQCSINILTA